MANLYTTYFGPELRLLLAVEQLGTVALYASSHLRRLAGVVSLLFVLMT